MRRGHPGLGGWRNDNPRHFRPRGGGTPHFRGSHGFPRPDNPRFNSPGPRRFPNPNSYNAHNSDHMSEQTNRDGYRDRGGRFGNQYHPQPFPRAENPRHILPLIQRIRQGDVPNRNSYPETPKYYDRHNSNQYGNSMGDVDFRQPLLNTPNRELINKPSPWVNPPFEERSGNMPFRHQDTDDRITQGDYSSQRPTSSDRFGSQGSTMDNSNTFSRSVDDTVDIVRKRLQNRESQSAEIFQQNEFEVERNSNREPMTSSYADPLQEPPPRRKSHSGSSKSVKSDCDKIKNKIVHQLFMMDKDKIHKLMDNPNCSSKFEYAISSLVTESQNSYNRHLRSVAEKSLSSSSSEFINDDNNTIYEDTFMRHMQCILEPQDSVLLEDIKPMVLAELSKVLQCNLTDFEHRQDVDERVHETEEQSYHNQYPTITEYDDTENFPNLDMYSPIDDDERYFDQKPPDLERSHTPIANDNTSNNADGYEEKPLFQRRPKNNEGFACANSFEPEHSRSERNFDKPEETHRRSGTPIPLFGAEQFSDEEDPFAELDKQYHVAVDHSFIENYDRSSPQLPRMLNISQPPIRKPPENPVKKTAPPKPLEIKNPIINIPPSKVKEEIDSQLQNMAKSPLKFVSPISIPKEPEIEIKQEPTSKTILCVASTKHSEKVKENKSSNSNNQQEANEPKASDLTPEKSNSAVSTYSRKHSTEQKPSHRKEKRKKSESSPSDISNKQILNKNIIINVTDCTKNMDSCDSSKSVFNLFFAKEKGSKDSKKSDSDKSYSDKYVKRKETSKSKDKDKEESKKKQDSNTSSHSILSPSDTSSSSISIVTPTKTEAQVKLKPIDMFGDSLKKSSTHHAHRNTAPVPASKPVVETKPIVISRRVTKRHVSTQVVRKSTHKEIQTEISRTSCSRFSQTIIKKLMTRGCQTNPVTFKTSLSSADTFERMKEIDMEIQALLQEKFKLYNSIESKESSSTKCNTMQSLGMAVINVAPEPCDNSISADDILNDFTSIPTEELEQIALETVQEERVKQKSSENQRRRKKSEKYSETHISPTLSPKKKRNSKAPNISLIEQIITDDRPLEEIISLNDLERPPSKSKKKSPIQTLIEEVELEETNRARSPKSKKKNQKTSLSKPKKKVTKPKVTKALSHAINKALKECDIKECSVVLKKEDLEKVLLRLKTKTKKENIKSEIINLVDILDNTSKEMDIPLSPQNTEMVSSAQTVIEEAVINDVQFDMLDVSEDIVIGDMCELKSEEKQTLSSAHHSACEEIILDNSQSSMDDVLGSEAGKECRTFDYAADDGLKRDSIVVSGNADAVLAIECIDNNFIAACLDGNIYYFNGDGHLMNTLRGSNLAVTCLTIVKEKYGITVYTGSLDSRIRYYDLETGMEKGPECNVLSPIQTMDRAWDTIFVGTRTGFVLQFECKNNMLIPVSTVKFSDQSILALRAMKEGPRKVLLVAARSEAVTIKDALTGLLLRTLEGPNMTVYTLLFEDGKVFCGTSSHQIHVFDYASGSHVNVHEGGKGAVCLRATGGLLFAGCYDGCVYIYRDGDSRPLAQLRGPSPMLLSLAVLGTKIIAGYKDRSLYIWKIPLSIVQEMIL